MIQRKYINLAAWAWAYLFVLFFTACQKQDWEEYHKVSAQSLQLELPFSMATPQLETRSTELIDLENRIDNLYLLVFDQNGQKQTSYFYAAHELNLNSSSTQGKIRVELPPSSSVRLFAVANVGSKAYQLTEDDLDQIESWTALQALQLKLSNLSTSRSDALIMTGVLEDAQSNEQFLNTAQIQTAASGQLSLRLRRLEAKVLVSIQTPEGVHFLPESWQLIRLAQGTELVSSDTYSTNQGFFDTKPSPFNKSSKDFSFYLLENKQAPNKWIDPDSPQAYQSREVQTKEPIAQPDPYKPGYTVNNKGFEYAPEQGTYMLLKGELSYTQSNGQAILANVSYRVHLGYSNHNPNDYSVLRNTDYRYTLTIESAESIILEVKQAKEIQAGASGHITQNKKVLVADAHYSTELIAFHFDDIGFMTWALKTPFSEGYREDLFHLPSEGDSDWVLFLVNQQVPNPDIYTGGYIYADYFRPFPGENHRLPHNVRIEEIKNNVRSHNPKLMTATQLVNLLVAFKKEQIDYGIDYFGANKVLHVTAFVSEFYYEAHPLTGEKEEELWKRFVNVPDRTLTFLNERRFSPDGESSLREGIISIRQKSIQTLELATRSAADTAWGVASTQEATELPFEVKPADNMGKHKYNSLTDGRSNTFEILKDASQSYFWGTYLNPYQQELLPAYKAAKYACLEHNRDNNANGKIEKEELRWYLASIDQLKQYASKAYLTESVWYASSTILSKDPYSRISNPYLLRTQADNIQIANLAELKDGQLNRRFRYICMRNLSK